MGTVGVLEVEAGCTKEGPSRWEKSLYRGYRCKSHVQAEGKGVGAGRKEGGTGCGGLGAGSGV